MVIRRRLGHSMHTRLRVPRLLFRACRPASAGLLGVGPDL